MKIERLSENQIRCTLTKSDLASRQLKINELAYGSEKARQLFRDMMKQASYEVGFEIEDTPVMIEAIPVSAECIVLIVTKVDNPEELDTRFSRFSPYDSGSDEDFDDEFDYDNIETIEADSTFESSRKAPTAGDELDETAVTKESPESILNQDLTSLFNKVKDYLNKNASQIEDKAGNAGIDPSQFVALKDLKANNKAKKTTDKPGDDNTQLSHPVIRVYSFSSLEDISGVAKVIDPIYSDYNSVFKNTKNGSYYLVLCRRTCTPVNFNKVCNILSEYGTKEESTDSSLAYFEEHYERIIERKAIHLLSHL